MKYYVKHRYPDELLKKAGFTREHTSTKGWARSLVKPQELNQTIKVRAAQGLVRKFDQIHAVVSGYWLSIHRDVGENATNHRSEQKHYEVRQSVKALKALDKPYKALVSGDSTEYQIDINKRPRGVYSV